MLGSQGRSHHWNGTTWTEHLFPVANLLPYTLVASAPDDIFAITQSGLIHFNGTQWTLVRLNVDLTTSPLSDLAIVGKRVDLLFARGQLRSLLRTKQWH